MDNIVKSVVFILSITTFLISCGGNRNSIEVLQYINNDNPVIFRLSKKHKKIFRVKIPVLLKLKNNSIQKKDFITINYKYGSDKNKGAIEFIFKKVGNELVEITNNEKKVVNSYSSKKYIVYTSHKIDSSKSIQQQFKSYIEKMLVENKDTLHIGTVLEFKKKHKELFEQLTKNDSISIRFLDGKKLGERITVPVKW